MLSYLSGPYATLPRSSSPLNPLRSSSPPHPLSSPTPSAHPPLPLSFSAHASGSSSGPGYGSGSFGQSSSPSRPRRAQASSSPGYALSSRSATTPKPLSARYVRGQNTRGSPRPTAPRQAKPALISSELFIESNTPTTGAMWQQRLARRMANREREKQKRDNALNRFRGMDDLDEPEDEDERERQAQADDEEIFRRLMVLQRRREQHAALVSHEYETGGSDPMLPDFWEDELSSLAHEERVLFRHLDESFSTSSTPTSSAMVMAGEDEWAHQAQAEADEEEMWAHQAAEAEEAEAAAEAEQVAYAERVEREMAQGGFLLRQSAHARGNEQGHRWMGRNDDAEMDEQDGLDWAAITAVEDDEAMDVE